MAVLIDDAHWLDGSSAQALLFAFRRLVADPIAVLIAVREGEPSLLDGADLPTLRIGGLSQRRGGNAGARAGAEAIRRLHGATAGNPLALLELAPDAGRDLVLAPEGAPVLVSARISRAFLRRVDLLDEAARQALVLAATSDSGDLPMLERAAARLGIDLSGAGRRGERGAGHAGRGRGGVPPSAGPVGDLCRRAGQAAPRRAPGARRRPARPGYRPPRVAPRRGGGRNGRNSVGGARAGGLSQP